MHTRSCISTSMKALWQQYCYLFILFHYGWHSCRYCNHAMTTVSKRIAILPIHMHRNGFHHVIFPFLYHILWISRPYTISYIDKCRKLYDSVDSVKDPFSYQRVQCYKQHRRYPYIIILFYLYFCNMVFQLHFEKSKSYFL